MEFFDKLKRHLTPRNILIFGLLVVLGATLSEVLRSKHLNYQIFAFATQDFWAGVAPYGTSWDNRGYLDVFLYAPPFNVLFVPWAFLPLWLGAFIWNAGNYLLVALAVLKLPYITDNQRRNILLYALPLIATSVLSFQYNMVVAGIFLWAYILLDRDRGFWAVGLIMLSACTKIYGGFELILLFFYPRFWRNIGYTVAWGGGFLLLPALKIGFTELPNYYGKWLGALANHGPTRPFDGFFDIDIIWSNVEKAFWRPIVQLIMWAAVVVGALFQLRRRGEIATRTGVLAVTMGYIILFSNSPEKHTYVIAMLGFGYWYFATGAGQKRVARILFWTLFVTLGLVPIDLVCPPVVMRLVCDTLDLNKWIFLVAWIYLCYETFGSRNKKLKYN